MKRIHGGLAATVAATVAMLACAQTAAHAPGGATDAGAATADAASFTVFPDQSDFACGSLPGLLDDLHPREAVDFLELRKWTFAYRDDGGGPLPARFVSVASTGTTCASAADPSACESTFATVVPRDSGWGSSSSVIDGIYTHGNVVGELTTKEELVTFLGTIDTLGEALLIAYWAGRALSCDTPKPASVEVSGPGWRRNPDGSWEIIVLRETCINDGSFPWRGIARERLRIDANGTARVVDAEEVPTSADPSCELRYDGSAERQTAAP